MSRSTVRFIAEAGENHLGDVDRARIMVQEAAKTGADFVKFQSFSTEDLSPSVDDETRDWIAKVQLDKSTHRDLKRVSEDSGIGFLSTAVNVRWADFLADLGCRAVKLASLSLTNLPLIEHASNVFDEVFISSGMGTLEEIDRALAATSGKAKITLFHCVSQYPTPDDDASLASVSFLRDHASCAIGYSDHTIGTTASIVAVSLGAELIEKHFTLDKTLQGTDHILSADPLEMTEIVRKCSRVGHLMGPGGKEPSAGELQNLSNMRGLFSEGA
jgi:N,N'-diacetyllegionaminate synthase